MQEYIKTPLMNSLRSRDYLKFALIDLFVVSMGTLFLLVIADCIRQIKGVVSLQDAVLIYLSIMLCLPILFLTKGLIVYLKLKERKVKVSKESSDIILFKNNVEEKEISCEKIKYIVVNLRRKCLLIQYQKSSSFRSNLYIWPSSTEELYELKRIFLEKKLNIKIHDSLFYI